MIIKLIDPILNKRLNLLIFIFGKTKISDIFIYCLRIKAHFRTAPLWHRVLFIIPIYKHIKINEIKWKFQLANHIISLFFVWSERMNLFVRVIILKVLTLRNNLCMYTTVYTIHISISVVLMNYVYSVYAYRYTFCIMLLNSDSWNFVRFTFFFFSIQIL